MAPGQQVGFTHIETAMHHFDEVVQWSIDNNSRIGYFAALYRAVTRGIYGWLYAPVPDPNNPGRLGGSNGMFQDSARMDEFVGAFAIRYYDAWCNRDTLGEDDPWGVHFKQCTKRRRLTVNQYLLSGANAHMNFDLPMAAVRVARENEHQDDDVPLFRSMQRLRGDFDRINDVLGSQVGSLQAAALTVSPVLRIGEALANRTAQCIEIAINWYRAAAWDHARELINRPDPVAAASPRGPRTAAGELHLLEALDPADLERRVASWGRLIGKPRWYVALGFWIISRFEPRQPRKVIRALLMDDADHFTWP